MSLTIMHQNLSERPVEAEAELAHDWTLFAAVENGATDFSFRCWEMTSPVVVLGRHTPEADVHLAACDADRVPVLRRFSGGGAVVIGPGCLNYALAASFVSWPVLMAVHHGFTTVLETLVTGLSVPGLQAAGLADLAIGGRKVSGNAQRRGQRALFHHGTLLYDFDPSLASRYLAEPIRQPAYRRSRRHCDFIGNLPLDAGTLRARVAIAERAFVPAFTACRGRST